jgi:hypothetical protein
MDDRISSMDGSLAAGLFISASYACARLDNGVRSRLVLIRKQYLSGNRRC